MANLIEAPLFALPAIIPRFPDLTGPVVPVLVGDKVFELHETVLKTSSEFFKNALKPEWRIDPSKPIDLSDANPKIFMRYSQWLYSGNLSILNSDSNSKYIFVVLAMFYVLGERILDALFQNTVIDAMVEASHICSPGLRSTRIIYNGTTAGSPARKFLADYCAWSLDHIGVKDLDPALDAEFSIDMVMAMIEYRSLPASGTVPPWLAHPEKYRICTAEENIKETESAISGSATEDSASSPGDCASSKDSMDTTT